MRDPLKVAQMHVGYSDGAVSWMERLAKGARQRAFDANASGMKCIAEQFLAISVAADDALVVLRDQQVAADDALAAVVDLELEALSKVEGGYVVGDLTREMYQEVFPNR